MLRAPALAVALLCAAAIAACTPAAGPSAGSDPVAGLDPAGEIAGEYRVAGIDGQSLDLPFGLALSITPQRIVMDAPCNGYAWDYRLDGKALSVSRTAEPDPECLARARIHHAVFDLAAAVDAATAAGRDPSHAVILAGGGHSVTLYSQ